MNRKSIRRVSLSILFSIMLLPVTGQAENSLWKASSDRGIFYIQGSVHLLKADDYPLASTIEEAYAKSDTLIFEADMKEMLSPKTQQLIMQKALLPDNRTLKDELDPEVYEQLSRELEKSGIPIAAVQKFKPWFISIMLMVPRMQALGLDPNLGLDQYFYSKASSDGKTTLGLETVEFQINLFNSLSDENQTAYTKYFLKDLERMETLLDDMIKAWKNGDIEALDKVVRDNFKEYPGMHAKFVTDRNKSWADKLDEMADKEKTCMVVVGCAHLAGKDSLLELLKAKGYAIEQL